MKDRIITIKKSELDRLQFTHQVEESLSSKLGIPSLRAGNIVIRDERNWGVNEKQVDYCWLIYVSRSFVGWCWLFMIKFNETQFRKIHNQEELIQGIFTVEETGEINDFFAESRGVGFVDKVKEISSLDMFDANKGISLDGVGYEYSIFSTNTEVRFRMNNPISESWRAWGKVVWELGRELSSKSNSKVMQEIFE